MRSAWFPASERGLASAIFNSAQYFATALTFVGASAAVARLSMLLLVGDSHRVELKKSLLPVAGA